MTASFDSLESSAQFAEEDLIDIQDILMPPSFHCRLGDIELSSETTFFLAGAYSLTVSTFWVASTGCVCVVTDAHNNEVFHQQFELVADNDEIFRQSINLDLQCCRNVCASFLITVQTCQETYHYPVHFCNPTITCYPCFHGEPLECIYDNVWQLWSRTYKFDMYVHNLHGPNTLKGYVQPYQQDGIGRKRAGGSISLETLTAPPTTQTELESFCFDLYAVNLEMGTYFGTFEMKVAKNLEHSVAVHGRMKIIIDVQTAEQLHIGSYAMILVVTKRPTDKKPRKRRLLSTAQISQQLELLQQSVQHLLENSVYPDDIQEVKASIDRASDSFRSYMRTIQR